MTAFWAWTALAVVLLIASVITCVVAIREWRMHQVERVLSAQQDIEEQVAQPKRRLKALRS